ncbi:hypothetical protein LCGC14_2832090 [marine sediment metagenome]|uniref:Uncharacterized protein n=1 Tax=marine sediment metagenome TaxID=412755 RepID=A0A0F8YDT5_9ZZZZ
MKQYLIKLSNEEEKALLSVVDDVKQHLEIIIYELARKAMARIIAERTNLQPQKLLKQECIDLIKDMEIETQLERKEREQREVYE